MAEITIASGTRLRLVGDLHLGDGGRNDAFGRQDALFLSFLRESERAADALVFMGDALDLPQGLAPRRIRRAHPQVFAALAALARRFPLYFVRGNHDWSVDYVRLFPGARACERLRVGSALAWHGHQLDVLCHPERRGHQFKVVLHHLAERAFGFAFRVPLHDFDTWQNRVAHWLGAGYGRHLRRMAGVYDALGLSGRAADCRRFIDYWSRSVWGDSHALFQPAAALLQAQGLSALICGHTHRPGMARIGERLYVNAGSWTYGAAQYAQWDGAAFQVRDARGGVVDSAVYRWLEAGVDPGDFFDWWRTHYRGWLRFGAALTSSTPTPDAPRVQDSTSAPDPRCSPSPTAGHRAS